MLPAQNKGAGMNMGFPDVCLTPAAPVPIPIPYPNMAMNAQAAPFAVKVILRGMNALNMGTKIPMTMGDEGGSAHPLFKQMGMYTMGNPKVMLEGLPAISLTMPTTGNMCNNPVGLAAVPSATNVLYTQRIAYPTLDLDACAALGRSVTRSDPRSRLVDGVEVLAVERFSRDLPSRLHALLTRKAPPALVIDLRGCAGGLLHVAIELADDFLAAGTPIVRVVDADGDEVAHHARHAHAHDLPLVLLVDGGTASAAEVFAGALAAAGRAQLVGAPTYGKASAAALRPADGRTTYAATAHCRLEGGLDLAGGLQPHVTSDRPVGRALELLADALEARA